MAITTGLQGHIISLEEEVREQVEGRREAEEQMLRLEGVVSHLLKVKETGPGKKKMSTSVSDLDEGKGEGTVAGVFGGKEIGAEVEGEGGD